MIEANPADKKEIHYQFSTYSNALDILVSKPNFQMVIDAKTNCITKTVIYMKTFGK